MDYTIERHVSGSFEEVVADVEDALAAEGFGVLCDIDVTGTFEKKLDEEFRDYRILGACIPPLAAEALETELSLGALLPCNVVVYASDDGDVVVAAVDPEQLVGIAENPDLDSVAADVRERFDRVLDAVAA
jgi:uncharacterized protein (DUF302 family)